MGIQRSPALTVKIALNIAVLGYENQDKTSKVWRIPEEFCLPVRDKKIHVITSESYGLKPSDSMSSKEPFARNRKVQPGWRYAD